MAAAQGYSGESADREDDLCNNVFIQTVFEEKRRLKALREKEIQMTAENPRIRKQEEEKNISFELRLQTLEKIVEEKRRQQLRETSHELRLLQNQLRIAHVAKQLYEQKAGLEKKKEEDYHIKRQENADFEKMRLHNHAITQEQERIERLKKQAFRGVLKNQILEKRTIRENEFEEIKRERINMIKIQKRLRENDLAELRELEQRKQRSKNKIREFLEAQNKFKIKQLSNNIDENKQFLEIMKERDKIKHQLDLEKKRKTEEKQALSTRIGDQLRLVENDKRRREDQLLDLLVEERKAKEDQRYRQSIEKQQQDRINVHMEMGEYQLKTIRLKNERQEKAERVRKVQMRDIEEQKNQERLSLGRREQKIREHVVAMQEIIESNRLERLAEANTNRCNDEFNMNAERQKQEAIEIERLRLLSLQSFEILRYLPANVLRESDRKYLGLISTKIN